MNNPFKEEPYKQIYHFGFNDGVKHAIGELQTVFFEEGVWAKFGVTEKELKEIKVFAFEHGYVLRDERNGDDQP